MNDILSVRNKNYEQVIQDAAVLCNATYRQYVRCTEGVDIRCDKDQNGASTTEGILLELFVRNVKFVARPKHPLNEFNKNAARFLFVVGDRFGNIAG